MAAPSVDSRQARLSTAVLIDGCRQLAEEKYGRLASSYIAARMKAAYFPPEDHYEALMDNLVDKNRNWLDVGCGRAPFPNNLTLSARVSERCPRFVGIDPDANIADNSYVHEHCQSTLESFRPERTFDLVSARMVVEHVSQPENFAASLRRVTAPGALVVCFTVNWWSISALAAHCSPMAVHHWAKKRLWETKESDTFPTVYRMNTRTTLQRLMDGAGFEETMFEVLPDAGLLWRIPVLRRVELACFKALRACGIPYVDSNLLAVYRRAK